jgi:hypothetical protein
VICAVSSYTTPTNPVWASLTYQNHIPERGICEWGTPIGTGPGLGGSWPVVLPKCRTRSEKLPHVSQTLKMIAPFENSKVCHVIPAADVQIVPCHFVCNVQHSWSCAYVMLDLHRLFSSRHDLTLTPSNKSQHCFLEEKRAHRWGPGSAKACPGQQ